MAKQQKMPWHSEEPAQNWATPRWLYDECESRFAGKCGFALDVAAEAWNVKAPVYFDLEVDGLAVDWTVRRGARINKDWTGDGIDPVEVYGNDRSISVWCNPPYDDLDSWVRKAEREVDRGSCRVAVMLIPARTDRLWWHEIVRPRAWHVEMIDGRVAFDPPPGVKTESPFEASAIVVFQKRICARR